MNATHITNLYPYAGAWHYLACCTRMITQTQIFLITVYLVSLRDRFHIAAIINSVPTPNIAREFFNSRPAVINVSNSSRNIARLNFCRLLSDMIFPPFVFVNKNTAVINGGWRLRTINRNSVVYSIYSRPSNQSWSNSSRGSYTPHW